MRFVMRGRQLHVLARSWWGAGSAQAGVSSGTPRYIYKVPTFTEFHKLCLLEGGGPGFSDESWAIDLYDKNKPINKDKEGSQDINDMRV